MKYFIVRYHKDEEKSHLGFEVRMRSQSTVQNNPLLVSRPWVELEFERESMLGYKLDCKKCGLDLPVDNT